MELLAENVVRPDRAVIVVTHDTRVLHYADSIARMDDGRIVETTRPADIPDRRAATRGGPRRRVRHEAGHDEAPSPSGDRSRWRRSGRPTRSPGRHPSGSRPNHRLRRPSRTFPNTVAAVGLIEPSTENISVGTPLSGVVAAVHVTAGQQVKEGDPLFELDVRQLRADLAVKKRALAVGESRVGRRQGPPRRSRAPARVRRAGEGPARRQRGGAQPAPLGRADGGSRARSRPGPRSPRPPRRSMPSRRRSSEARSVRRSTRRCCRSSSAWASSRPRRRRRRR